MYRWEPPEFSMTIRIICPLIPDITQDNPDSFISSQLKIKNSWVLLKEIHKQFLVASNQPYLHPPRLGTHPSLMLPTPPPPKDTYGYISSVASYTTYRPSRTPTSPPPSDYLHQRLFIDRPAALSAVCLSWLGRIWNLGEGGLLCTKQASQHSIFCTASDCST